MAIQNSDDFISQNCKCPPKKRLSLKLHNKHIFAHIALHFNAQF